MVRYNHVPTVSILSEAIKEVEPFPSSHTLGQPTERLQDTHRDAALKHREPFVAPHPPPQSPIADRLIREIQSDPDYEGVPPLGRGLRGCRDPG